MHHLARAVYSALLWLVQPLLRAKLARRAKVEALYGQLVDERFGYYSAAVAHTAPGAVWVHAVSLGETRAAALLITQLRASLPDMRLLLTHGTATGRAEGAALLQVGDVQVWQPWDTQGACERFFAQFKPRIGIVMETEVWPNLCRAAQHHGVPMVLANARLNAASQSAAPDCRRCAAGDGARQREIRCRTQPSTGSRRPGVACPAPPARGHAGQQPGR